jgi:uncharacterized damage-inducible protein DinB
MSDFAILWALSRSRFLDEIAGLSKEQLNWRIHDRCLSIGEMALHMAGVEISFASQLKGYGLDSEAERIKRSATEGVVNDQPFPFSEEEITPELVASAMDLGRSHWEPAISAATTELRAKEIKSALGPIITGEGAFARLGFHSAYHQGQAYLIKTAPGFPPS